MKNSKVKILTEDNKIEEAIAPIILSVSRATDIPAFYAEWFFNRLEKGYCKWINPFTGKPTYVSFENVRFIVFWSKNPAPLIPYLKQLKQRGIKCYIQYTLNDYQDEGLEPGVPDLEFRIETFKKLSGLLGPRGVPWRFDPLILTDSISISGLLHKIESIGEELKNKTEKLIFSFADITDYKKVSRNLKTHGVNYREWDEISMRDFARHLANLKTRLKWNFQFSICAERLNLEEFGISANKCIDDAIIARIAWDDTVLMKHLGIEIKSLDHDLFGESLYPENAVHINDNLYGIISKSIKDKGQRKLCGCINSKDIGQYNTCAHQCLYCYANTSPQSAMRNVKLHNSHSETIIPYED